MIKHWRVLRLHGPDIADDFIITYDCQFRKINAGKCIVAF